MQEKTGTPISALWQAAYCGDREAVKRLIKEEVDVNIWDKWGRTALLFAITSGHSEIARDLVRAGAWVDSHEDYDTYDTPLMQAAITGNREMVEYLLAEGADPTLHVGISQMTAESYARHTYPEIAEILLKAENEKRA